MIVSQIGNEVILSANEIMWDILTTPFRLIKYIYKKRMKKYRIEQILNGQWIVKIRVGLFHWSIIRKAEDGITWVTFDKEDEAIRCGETWVKSDRWIEKPEEVV